MPKNDILFPKIIHRIWMVFNPNKPEISALNKENDRILKELHPNWQFMEWDDKKVLNFVHDHYPDFFQTYIDYDVPVKRHDASRYLILKHYGGVFIQHTFRFQKSIDDFVGNASLILSKKTLKFNMANELANNFMATVPNHLFWDYLINKLPQTASTHVMASTGPWVVRDVLKEYQNEHNDTSIKILGPEYIFPFYFFEKNEPKIKENCIDNPERCFDLYPDYYAFCPWASSWNEAENKVARVDLSLLDNNTYSSEQFETTLIGAF
jgi:mannosyltransferase OCH1-like enzyme